MDRKNILDEVILGYRQVIRERYQYDYLEEAYDLPVSFDQARVDRFRDFFLENIYPGPEKRDELNEAFNSLDEYIKSPEKLLRLLVESAKLVFKYGRHLPKILSAGMKALRSFRSANSFEGKLVDQAITSGKQPPFDRNDIEGFIGSLNKSDIASFIEHSKSLFETLHDRELVIKITEIVEHLINSMKNQPQHYSSQEISGLELGRDIIKGGDALFAELSGEEQTQIFEFVIDLEKNLIEKIFSAE